jgi:hypothetical protein
VSASVCMQLIYIFLLYFLKNLYSLQYDEQFICWIWSSHGGDLLRAHISGLWCYVVLRGLKCWINISSPSSGLDSFLFGLLFNPESGGDMLLWNSRLSLNYTALQPRNHILQTVPNLEVITFSILTVSL